MYKQKNFSYFFSFLYFIIFSLPLASFFQICFYFQKFFFRRRSENNSNDTDVINALSGFFTKNCTSFLIQWAIGSIISEFSHIKMEILNIDFMYLLACVIHRGTISLFTRFHSNDIQKI